MLVPIRTEAPTELPVSLAEAKAQLQIDATVSDWDDLLTGMLNAAVAYVDGWSGVLGRCLVTQTWEARFECFEAEFDLPFPDVSAVVVKYYDTSNTLQTYSSSNYQLVQESCGSEVSVYLTSTWPATSLNREDVVVITMTVGYGAATAVPAAIKQAILMIVGHWFANRETVNVGNITTELPFSAAAMLAPFRRVGI